MQVRFQGARPKWRGIGDPQQGNPENTVSRTSTVQGAELHWRFLRIATCLTEKREDLTAIQGAQNKWQSLVGPHNHLTSKTDFEER